MPLSKNSGNLVAVFMSLAGLGPEKKASQVKSFPLTISGFLPVEEAMITAGGISTKEINSRTMEPKTIPGLYFAGEIIDGSASSGGYNLQQAFSTGYLAEEKKVPFLR